MGAHLINRNEDDKIIVTTDIVTSMLDIGKNLLLKISSYLQYYNYQFQNTKRKKNLTS